MSVRVMLASTSPARLMLLRQAGIEPETHAPGLDEDASVADAEKNLGRALTPEEHVTVLAQKKAAAVVTWLGETEPGFDGLVIGGDSMFEYGGEIFGKPHHANRATERWQKMRGGTGVLHSGHALIRVKPNEENRHAQGATAAQLHFVDDLSDDEIAAYVRTGEPLEVAGAFTLDGRGSAFIDRVEGDPSTVVGMSIPTLRQLTQQLGVIWTELWNIGV